MGVMVRQELVRKYSNEGHNMSTDMHGDGNRLRKGGKG